MSRVLEFDPRRTLSIPPRSMPPPKVPPIPRDYELKEHFIRLRQETLARVQERRTKEIGLALRDKHWARRQRKLEANKRLQVVLRGYSINQVALKAGLRRCVVWKVLMGRVQGTTLTYLKICRAIQRLARTPRQTIDLHLLRVLKDPIP